MNKTTIQLEKSTLERLRELKRHPMESYDQTINFLVDDVEEELSVEEIEEVEEVLKEIRLKGIDKTTSSIEEVAKEFGVRLRK